MAAESRAQELEKKAERKQRPPFAKPQEAADLFTQAANLYKVDRQWNEAGHALERAAACIQKADERGESVHEVVAALVEASGAYRHVSPEDSLRTLEQANSIELERGNIKGTARLEKMIAELYEQDGNIQAALDHYERCADLNRTEEAPMAAQACMQKVALLCSLHKGEYPRAAKIYEDLATEMLRSPLTQYAARDNYLKAGICRLVIGDLAAAREAVEKYQTEDNGFGQTRECKLLLDMCTAAEKDSIEDFTVSVFEYDAIAKLDQWKTTLLLKAKTAIQQRLDDRAKGV